MNQSFLLSIIVLFLVLHISSSCVVVSNWPKKKHCVKKVDHLPSYYCWNAVSKYYILIHSNQERQQLSI